MFFRDIYYIHFYSYSHAPQQDLLKSSHLLVLTIEYAIVNNSIASAQYMCGANQPAPIQVLFTCVSVLCVVSYFCRNMFGARPLDHQDGSGSVRFKQCNGGEKVGNDFL